MLKKSLKVGLLVGGATWLVATGVKMFNIPTIEFRASVVDVRSQIETQGSAPAFGQYMLDLFKGYIPADPSSQRRPRCRWTRRGK